ncbi:hypothetical protein OC834_004941 [Tilletia horrida]|nr:hypothetical protein OC834_004941 [Tilletia horrida]
MAAYINTAPVSTFVPNAYIVRFKPDDQAVYAESPTVNRLEQIDESAHIAFETYLQVNKVQFEKRISLKDRRFPLAMSLILASPGDVSKIETFDRVESIERIKMLSVTGPRGFQSRAFYEEHSSAGLGVSVRARADPDGAYVPHQMTGIDKLHREGIRGKGQTIGIIDTGIDYTHPALNGGKPAGTPCFGEGCPIAGGAQLISDNGTVQLGPDPFASCNGHGTHVAGIIAAKDPQNHVSGAAPDAAIYAYRALDCNGFGSNDIIAAAFQRAFFDGVDIISASLGEDAGWTTGDILGDTAAKIVRLGVPVVVSSGNSGESGMFFASSPAAASGVTSVGMVDNLVLTGRRATAAAASGNLSIVYIAEAPIVLNGTLSLPVYATSPTINYENDACSALPESTPDLSKFVTLIGRGKNCTLISKVNNAIDKGARIVLIYDNDQSRALDVLDGISNITLAFIPKDDGERLVKVLATSKEVQMSFSDEFIQIPNYSSGGLMDYRSSYGPTWELSCGVTLSAVGGYILSTVPIQKGSYQLLTGTSMAAPQLAGAYALLRSANGKSDNPAMLRSIFVSTSRPATFNQTQPGLDTVVHQGAGLMDAYAAVHSVTRISPDRLHLNDTTFFNGTQSFTLTNVGSKPQNFTFSHISAQTFATFDASSGNGTYLNKPAPIPNVYASVDISPKKLTLSPGQKQTVHATFKPLEVDQSLVPVVSGFLRADSDTEFGSVSVPYMGVAASLKQVPILTRGVVNGIAVPSLLDSSKNDTAIEEDGQVFDLNDNSRCLQLAQAIHAGTTYIASLLVHANATLDTLMTDAGTHAQSQQSAARSNTSVVATLDQGMYLGRSDQSMSPVSVFNITAEWTDMQNVTRTIPDGKYRVLITALRLRGDPRNGEDYDRFLSHAFEARSK